VRCAGLKIRSYIKAFTRQQYGATAIEYGLITAAIAIAIMVVVFTMGESLAALMSDITGFLENREPLD
jgi:pilus assembly protein Flp/PilA